MKQIKNIEPFHGPVGRQALPCCTRYDGSLELPVEDRSLVTVLVSLRVAGVREGGAPVLLFDLQLLFSKLWA